MDVKDILPPGVTFVDGSADQGACVSGICQLGDAPVNVGDPITIQITGTVGSDVLPGSLTNTTEAFSDTPDPGQYPNSDSDTFNVTILDDVTVTKVDLKDPVAPTEGLLYEIVVSNNGPSDSQNVVVSDTLDPNVTFSSASLGCLHDGSPSGGVVTCSVATLPAGESRTFLIGVTVNDVDVAQVPTLTNNVSAVSDTDQTPASDSETTTVETPIGPVSDLSISKDDQSEPVLAGENVTYDITVTNNGPSVATNVRVLELVPAGTTALSLTASNPDADDEDCSLGGSCYLGTMQVGTVATITVVLQVNPDFQGSSLTNTASVSADQADDDPSDNIASDDTAITTEADLSIEKVDLTDPVYAGDVLLYQISISNSGPSDAQAVVVTDTVPTNTTFSGASPECSLSSGDVVCSLPSLAAGASRSFWVEVRVNEDVPDGNLISNTATVDSDTEDPIGGDNTDFTSTTVYQPDLNPTDLVISKDSSPDPVTAGENLTYNLTVTNNGPAVASNVLVVDALPSGVTFVSADASQGICNSGVTCDLGDLAVSASATITIVVSVDSDQVDEYHQPGTRLRFQPGSGPGQ